MDTKVNIKKVDGDQQLVYGEVYAPVLYPDTDGDIMFADEIAKIAHKFISSGHIDKIDLMHDGEPTGSKVVESFLARDNDPDFITGSWVLGVKIESDELWEQVKSGYLNGFSMEITAKSVPIEIEMEIPEVVTGKTTEAEGHVHKFYAYFNDDGEFIGGETDEQIVAGKAHRHVIRRGTVTEKAEGHTHRFSMVDLFAGFTPAELEEA